MFSTILSLLSLGCSTSPDYLDDRPIAHKDLSLLNCENLIAEEIKARKLMIWTLSTDDEQKNHDLYKGIFSLGLFFPAAPVFMSRSVAGTGDYDVIKELHNEIVNQMKNKGCSQNVKF